jgi:hypothetical protein
MIADHVQAARGIVEAALDAASWPWSRRLTLWLALLIIEEQGER